MMISKKIVRQHDEKDCGAACTVMIAKSFGIHLSLSEARELLKIDNNGCSVFAMTTGIKKMGISAEAYSFDNIEELEKQINDGTIHLPIVINIITDNMLSHYTIITDISKKITISDPAVGKMKISREKLKTYWTGIVIVYNYKKTEFSNISKGTKFTIHDITKENYKQLFKIGLDSVILSVLSLFNIGCIQKFVYLLSSTEVHEHIFQIDDQCSKIGIAHKISHLVNYCNNILNNKYNIIIILSIICIIRLIYRIRRGKKYVTLSTRFDKKMFDLIFSKSLSLPISFFESRKVGELVTRFNEAFKVRDAYINIVSILLNDLISILILNTALIIICKPFILFEISIICIYIFYSVISNKILASKINMLMIQNEKIYSYITNIYSNILTVKNFSKSFFYQQFTEKIKDFVDSTKNVMKLNVYLNSANNFICECSIAILLLIGLAIYNKGFNVNIFLIIFLVINYLLEYIKNIGDLQINIQNLKCGMDRICDVMEANSEQTSQPIANMALLANQKIMFNHVGFSYGFRNDGVKNISFSVCKGDRIALVGNTGSGKSTIAKLIMNYYNPSTGEIYISNNQKLGYLSQEICVFNMSIRDNILMGRTGISDELFNKICKITLVDKIAINKVFGYDTIMDEKGYDFSKGERQRIALARVLIDNPDIIVFDEMGSNLDIMTEREIIQNILDEFKDNVLVFISHRLSTINFCNCIYVLQDGKIIEKGTHDTLLMNKNVYYNMWENQ